MSQRSNKLLIFLRFILLWPLFSVHALPSDKTRPVHITSDTAHLDKLTGISVFQGHVILTQGTSILKTEKLILYTDKNNQLLKAVAIGGNPTYSTMTDPKKPPFTTAGQTIQYIPPQHKIILLGHAKAVQGPNTYAAPQIEYHIDNEMIISVPSNAGRTTIVIAPQSFEHAKPH